MRRLPVWALLLWVLFLPFAASGAECLRPCAGQASCEREVAECLLAAGESRAAIDYLKEVLASQPERVDLYLLLARAYLADGNSAWALRTLKKALEKNPRHCHLLGWQAWIQLGEGNLQAAEDTLSEEECPDNAAEEGRWNLLRALLADARSQPQAAEFLRRAESSPLFYRGDEQIYYRLRSRLRPGWLEPFSLKIETSFGYTSNARAGAPADPDSRGAQSLLGRLDVFSRFVWPREGFLRPALDAGLKGHGIGEQEERSFSYLELFARPGVFLGSGTGRLLLGYRADYLVMARDSEAERRFYEGHRGELELESGHLTVFAGFGRRIFAESGRTRWEIDGGAGAALELSPRASLLLAAALRYYWARGQPYRLFGLSGLSALRYRLSGGLYGRLGLSLGWDDYFESGGRLGLVAFGSQDRRRDLLTRASAELWGPPFWGGRAALGYEISWRASSLDESSSTQVYDFVEHRLLLKLRWDFDWNPWLPKPQEPAAGVALPAGAQEGGGLSPERIQDLLRQDEAARRGSSCVQ